MTQENLFDRSFAKKWNEEQFEFNQDINHNMELAVEESDEEERGHRLREGIVYSQT